MRHKIANLALLASASLLCSCDNIVPTAESMAPTITARWVGEGKIIINVGSGNLEKSSPTAMDGKVTIEYQ
jgi:5,10-methylene-tetrahydrofolate dehydrogenase/methenyl tetrahydrofolate cyclohydrolase